MRGIFSGDKEGSGYAEGSLAEMKAGLGVLQGCWKEGSLIELKNVEEGCI